VSDDAPSPLGRTILEAAARDLLQQPFEVTRHVAGVRVTLPDKRPVIGTHPQEPRLGLVNGLGAKGALWAPWLAQQWVDHLQSGAPFDPEANVARFFAD
jgi:glycine/D-amino acid oxidase-like deaminating enzyme